MQAGFLRRLRLPKVALVLNLIRTQETTTALSLIPEEHQIWV